MQSYNNVVPTKHTLCIYFFTRTIRHRRNPERHGCRNRRARRETVQGAAGQAGHDAGVIDGEGEVGVIDMNAEIAVHLSAGNTNHWDSEEMLWKSRFDSTN